MMSHVQMMVALAGFFILLVSWQSIIACPQHRHLHTPLKFSEPWEGADGEDFVSPAQDSHRHITSLLRPWQYYLIPAGRTEGAVCVCQAVQRVLTAGHKAQMYTEIFEKEKRELWKLLFGQHFELTTPSLDLSIPADDGQVEGQLDTKAANTEHGTLYNWLENETRLQNSPESKPNIPSSTVKTLERFTTASRQTSQPTSSMVTPFSGNQRPQHEQRSKQQVKPRQGKPEEEMTPSSPVSSPQTRNPRQREPEQEVTPSSPVMSSQMPEMSLGPFTKVKVKDANWLDSRTITTSANLGFDVQGIFKVNG